MDTTSSLDRIRRPNNREAMERGAAEHGLARFTIPTF